MAASKPNRRIGCRVTSAASAGVLHSSRNDTFLRTSRYSGRYRPAWRIIHSGGRGVARPRQASRNRDPVEGGEDTECFYLMPGHKPMGVESADPKSPW